MSDQRHTQLAAIDGLTFADCTRFFSDRQTAREHAIVALAETQAREGELEIDETAIVSAGVDHGAYVMAWTWVDFAGTAFDPANVVHLEVEGEDGSALCGATEDELLLQLAAVGPHAREPTHNGDDGSALCTYCLAAWRRESHRGSADMNELPVIVGAEGVSEIDGQTWWRYATDEEAATHLASLTLPHEDLLIDGIGRPYWVIVLLADAPAAARTIAETHTRVLRVLP